MDEIPPRYRKEWKLGDGVKFDLPAVKAWKVLHEKQPQNPYAEVVYGKLQSLEDILKKRNLSILAHGEHRTDDGVIAGAFGACAMAGLYCRTRR